MEAIWVAAEMHAGGAFAHSTIALHALTKNGSNGHLRAPVNRARVGSPAARHAVDDIYQGAVPALPPFFIAGHHYSYAAATGLTFTATAMSSVIQPVFGALTGGRPCAPAAGTPSGVSPCNSAPQLYPAAQRAARWRST